MARIPVPAFWLGLAGLIPFLYGAIISLGVAPLHPTLTAEAVLVPYGAAILAFMGGCLWGFAATRDQAPAWRELGLSVVPPLWAFSAQFHPAPLSMLAAGFVVLIAVDMIFVLRRLTPPWWMALRLPLSGVVLLCLLAGAVG
ncbi:MAG: DUF3429 domain-containing protein [Pseudomonadota bacterium]